MKISKEKEYATKWSQAAQEPKDLIGKSRSFLRYAMLTLLSLTNRALGDRFLRCLYFHNVFSDQINSFERLLLGLKHYGTFINTDTCVQMLKGERNIDNRYYHLSFDDGFRNNFVNAFPVLQKHNIPCVFFVPSSMISANWEQTKRYCLETTRYNGVIEMLKWEDLREMVVSGYEIGSHTRTHSRLASISQNPVLLEDELRGSKKEIETNLGIECKYISWPFGLMTDINEASLEMIKCAGYHACFGAFRGSVVPGVTNIFVIPRHDFDAQWPFYSTPSPFHTARS